MRFPHTLKSFGRGRVAADKLVTAAAAAAVATARARWSLRALWKGTPSLEMGNTFKIVLGSIGDYE